MIASLKVSVVIPTYKSTRFIAETLESVFGQLFTDYEVIVVNDGTPDTEAFERAIAPYADRIRYVKQANRGASAARNAGLHIARGEFVAFLDADDLWLPNYLHQQLRFLHEHDCDLVCANAMIFGDSRHAGRTFMDAYMIAAPESGEITFLDLLSAERCLITSGVLVRRALVVEAGLFDEALRNAQDYDLWLRISRQTTRLAFHREVLLRHRIRGDSLSGDAINMNLRDLRVFDKIEDTYAFSSDERGAVSSVIRSRRASLEFENGKLYLLKDEYRVARDSFRNATAHGGGWKSRAALMLTRVAPRLLHTLYARRLNRER